MKYTTLNEIKKYGPCIDGWEKLLKGLGKTKADDEPLSFKYILERNGAEDAVWALRVLPFKDQALFLADVAESILHIFEHAYPTDLRPRQAIEALRKYAAGKTSLKELSAAADDSNNAAIIAFTDDAYAAAHAAYAAAYAATANAHAAEIAAYADAGTYEDADATADAIKEATWQITEKLFVKHFCGDTEQSV